MPRPKGSKNKRTLEFEAHAGELLDTKKADVLRLTAEQTHLMEEIDAHQDRLKAIRKELNRTRRDIERLTAIEAEKANTANEQALYQLVNSLLKDGMSSDDILRKIQT